MVISVFDDLCAVGKPSNLSFPTAQRSLKTEITIKSLFLSAMTVFLVCRILHEWFGGQRVVAKGGATHNYYMNGLGLLDRG